MDGWALVWALGVDKTGPACLRQASGLSRRQNQLITRQLMEASARCLPGSERSVQWLTLLQTRKLRHGPSRVTRAGRIFQEWSQWSGLSCLCALIRGVCQREGRGHM